MPNPTPFILRVMTPEQQDEVVRMYEARLTLREIVAAMATPGLNPGHVLHFCQVVRGLPPQRNRGQERLKTRWTEKEDAVLRAHYATVMPKVLGARLGRSPGAVKMRAKALRLHRLPKQAAQQRDLKLLIEHTKPGEPFTVAQLRVRAPPVPSDPTLRATINRLCRKGMIVRLDHGRYVRPQEGEQGDAAQ